MEQYFDRIDINLLNESGHFALKDLDTFKVKFMGTSS